MVALNGRDNPPMGRPNARRERGLRIACILLLASCFAAFATDGLHAYFTADDGGNLINMHEAWEHSLAGMAGSALRVATGAYRPLGGIYYLALYRIAGFHPLPFRAVCLSLMLVNVLLAFFVLRRLSGSIDAALLGALLLACHPALLWLFYSSGMIYEILCFLFYFLALLFYVRWRQEGAATLSWKRVALLLALTACALDSKEMAMTLPATLLWFEFIYFPQQWRSWRDVAHFAARQGRGVLAAALLTAPAIAAKLLTANPLSNDPRYRGHSFRSVIDAMRGYQSALLYLDIYRGGLSTAGLLLVWTGLAALAIAFRSRPMKFGLCLTLTALAPLSVIRAARRLHALLALDGMGTLPRIVLSRGVRPAGRDGRPGASSDDRAAGVRHGSRHRDRLRARGTVRTADTANPPRAGRRSPPDRAIARTASAARRRFVPSAGE